MAIAVSCASLADGARISISPDAKGMDMPKTMYGIFFEDINYAADGGIYPELLANRGFDWKTKDLEGWEADYRGGAMARITVQETPRATCAWSASDPARDAASGTRASTA